MSARIKGEEHKAVVRSVMLYDLETGLKEETRKEAVELKVFRFSLEREAGRCRDGGSWIAVATPKVST